MKKIKNNKVYDTDTAIQVGEWASSSDSRDFEYFAETLYRKKTGEYFLYGWGGANSKYGKWHGNSGGSGETIIPLTLQEAMQWAETYMSADLFVAEFGEPSEDDSKTRIGLTISIAAKERLEAMRRDTGESISTIIEKFAMSKSKDTNKEHESE